LVGGRQRSSFNAQTFLAPATRVVIYIHCRYILAPMDCPNGCCSLARGILAALTLADFAGHAQATELAIKGGPGGGFFRDECPTGEFLVGFRLRAGSWIDAVNPLCAPLDNGRLEPRHLRQFHGGNGGGPQEAYCQPDSLLLGISVTYTRGGSNGMGAKCANSIRLNCWPIRGGVITQVCMETGESCDWRAGGWDLFCPYGEAATGIQGRSGLYVDAWA
jgi:hypothetical protein